MKEIKPIKIAVLSCIHGHASRYLTLGESPFFEVMAASVVPGSENTRYFECPCPTYQSDEELYANHPELEAVVIGSENKNHYKQFMEAARRGLHIISMKVPTLNMQEYQEMTDILKEKKIVCLIERELSRYGEVQRAAELIRRGDIGELQSISITNYSHNPVWWRPWQCDPELSYGEEKQLRPGDERFRGGALTDHIHPFYLIRQIAGSDFDTVYANVTPNIRDGVRTEDMVRLIGKLKNGVNFSIDPSYANNEYHMEAVTGRENSFRFYKYPKICEVFMTAVGSKGTIVAELYGKNTYLQYPDDFRYIVLSEAHDFVQLPNSELTAFYKSIRGGAAPATDFDDYLNSIKPIVAGYESIYSGKIVSVDSI